MDMVRLALVAFFAGLALMPFVSRYDGEIKGPLAYSESAQLGTIDDATVYVASSDSGVECRLITKPSSIRSDLVQADRHCAEVFDGLERVSVWAANPDGTVHLADGAGKTVLIIGPSDGFAYEATNAGHTQISFVVSDI
jgi:hypothetical protein